jgi:predicted alpha/beta hydrolase family esterase
VAPANPARFGENGFSRDSQTDYSTYFQQLKLQVPTTLLISENDPWLSFEDAHILAQTWKIKPINLGAVGHVNVASGFGPFPEIEHYLISENTMPHISKVDESKCYFKFAF